MEENIQASFLKRAANPPLASSRPLRPKKSPTPLGHGSEAEGYMRHLENELRKGRIPPFLIEDGRLIGKGAGEGTDQVIAYIQGLLDRLAEATTQKKATPVEIFLSDLEGLRAGVITKGERPLLIVGLGLIDFLVEAGMGEDHLAAILSHERFHIRRNEKWKHLENGRPEEESGDVYGVIETSAAGYNPRAMGEIFAKIQEIEEREKEKQRYNRHKGLDALASLLDEHPSLAVRIRNTEIALAGLQGTKRLQDGLIPLPEEILRLTDAAHFKDHWERYREKTGYAQASATRKTGLLASYLSARIREEDVPLLKLRMMETIASFDALRASPAAAAAGGVWFDRLMRRRPDRRKRYNESEKDNSYRWALEQFLRLKNRDESELKPWVETSFVFDQGRSEWKPLVEKENYPSLLRQAPKQAARFLEAKTREEAVRTARRLERARHRLTPYKDGLRVFKIEEPTVEWPKRGAIKDALAKGNPIRLPWEDHVRWAQDERGRADENALIGRTALSLRAYDPRFSGGERESYWIKQALGERGFSDLVFNAEGFITALRPSQEEMDVVYEERFKKSQTYADLLMTEEKIQKLRDAEEEGVLKTVDWTAMEEDFWGFAKKYADYLQPSLTLVPGRHVFARAFTERLRALRAKDPARWETTFLSFYTGKSVEQIEDDEDYSLRERNFQPFSLPDLVQKFERRYLGYENPKHRLQLKRGTLPRRHAFHALWAGASEWFPGGERPKKENRFVGKDGDKRYVERRYRAKAISQQQVEVYPHIDVQHPYLEDLLKLSPSSEGDKIRGDISLRDKKEILAKFSPFNFNARRLEDFFSFDFGAAIGLSGQGLTDNFQKLDRLLHDKHINGAAFEVATPVILLKALRETTRAAGPKYFPFSDVTRGAVINHFHFFNDAKLSRRLQKELAALVEAQIEINRRIDFAPDLPLETLMERFDKGHRREDSLFLTSTYAIFEARPSLQAVYQDHLRSRIDALPLKERAVYLEKILSRTIDRPDYRNWAIESWVAATAADLGGLDDGSAAYAAKASARLEHLWEHIHPSQGIRCILKLLDVVEAQEELSFFAKNNLIDRYGQEFFRRDAAARMIDALTELCGNNLKLGNAFLKFVTEAETKKGNAAFLQALWKNAPKNKPLEKILNAEGGLLPAHEEQILSIGYLHRDFWSLPFEVRTVYLDRLLFPLGDKAGKYSQEAIDFALDKVLPLDRKFSEEAREALLVYLDVCPPELRRVTFSALLSASEPKDGVAPLRPGQVLSYVMARTGAAGGQLLQAAHSALSGYDLKDPDLRQFHRDLKSSKVDFNRPFRWEIFERMAQVLPEAFRKTILRVAALLGSGSTAYVVAIKKADGTKKALKLMRKDVLPVADIQFERYGAAFTELAARHRHYAILPSLVDRATETIQTSTDGRIGAKQIAYAQGLLNPLRLRVNGRLFEPKVAAAHASGKDYLEMDYVAGLHIGDLLVATPQEAAYRREAAIAIDMAEEFASLSGGAIDEDCHGGQQKMEGFRIGRFDVGAIPFDRTTDVVALPSQEEKRAAGRLYGLVLNATLQGEAPVAAMTRLLTSQDWGAAKPYLVGLQKGRLARMDFLHEFGQTAQEKTQTQEAILKAVWATGRVDPALIDGLGETLSLSSVFKLAKKALKPYKEKALSSASCLPWLGALFAAPTTARAKDDLALLGVARPCGALLSMARFLRSFARKQLAAAA